MIEVTTTRSPVGPLTVAARDERVCLLYFGEMTRSIADTLGRWYPAAPLRRAPDPAGAVRALRAYFDGDLAVIDDLAVEFHGRSFQRNVWEALRKIPAGTTCSYGELARRIGAPSAVRAVGAANGANPVAIIVPCHRVIGANGTLTGYGGGLDRKRWLLQHEAAQRRLFAAPASQV
jgi:O-6-methylguanine DNA methyltransferase